MAVNPIDIVAVTGSQDYMAIKHNEDHKAMNMQSTLFEQGEKGNEQKMSEVEGLEAAEWLQKGLDGRDKGNNTYYGEGGKGKKKSALKKKGEKLEQVIVNGHKSFDIKI